MALLSALAPQGWVPDATRLYSASSPSAQSSTAIEALSSPALAGSVDGAQTNEALSLNKVDDVDIERLSVLQEFRCLSVVQRVFHRGQRRIVAEVFSFPSSEAAYAAYHLLRHGATTIVTRGDASSEEEQSISFWKDRYFVRVFGSSEDDSESKDVVRAIADQLVDSISGHALPPPVISRLPAQERVRGSEKLVMGPLSARRFFPAPNILLLPFTNFRAAAVADYQMQDPYPERLKLLVAFYADSSSALRAYQQYLDAFSREQDNVEPAPGKQSLFKVGDLYLLCRCSGEQLLIVSGARKKTSARILARMIY